MLPDDHYHKTTSLLNVMHMYVYKCMYDITIDNSKLEIRFMSLGMAYLMIITLSHMHGTGAQHVMSTCVVYTHMYTHTHTHTHTHTCCVLILCVSDIITWNENTFQTFRCDSCTSQTPFHLRLLCCIRVYTFQATPYLDRAQN